MHFEIAYELSWKLWLATFCWVAPVGRLVAGFALRQRAPALLVALASCRDMKRWLEINPSPAVADGVSRRELFRMAAEQRLINNDVEGWMRYHAARNLVAHTYVPEVAAQVYAIVGEFDRDAGGLLAALEARND